MNKEKVVSDGQRNVEGHETRRKVGKNTRQKTHIGNNQAKLNDAKSTIHARFFAQTSFEKQGKVCVLPVLKP